MCASRAVERCGRSGYAAWVSKWPKPLPGGRYEITRAENEKLCAAVGSLPDASGAAHPIFYYIAGQCGMGISVEKLLAMCEFDVADGPMMTQSAVQFDAPLRVDETYGVSGEIIDLVRKPSRTFGAVDQLSFRVDLVNSTGARALSTTHKWILPRPGKVAQ